VTVFIFFVFFFFYSSPLHLCSRCVAQFKFIRMLAVHNVYCTAVYRMGQNEWRHCVSLLTRTSSHFLFWAHFVTTSPKRIGPLASRFAGF